MDPRIPKHAGSKTLARVGTVRPGPGRPRKLNHQRIVEAAIAVMEKEGFAALTIRSLATELGTTHSTLYNYVAHVEDIEAEALHSLTSEIPLPVSEKAAQLRIELIDFLMAARRMVLKHPRVLYPQIGSPSWATLSEISTRWVKALAPYTTGPHLALVAHGALMSYVAITAERERAYGQNYLKQGLKGIEQLLEGSQIDTLEDVLEILIDQLLPGLARR